MNVELKITWDADKAPNFPDFYTLIDWLQKAGVRHSVDITQPGDGAADNAPADAGTSSRSPGRGRVGSKVTTATKPSPVDVAGEPESDDDDIGLGTEQPNLTPAEALEQGLGIIRNVFINGKQGNAAAQKGVKALQTKWGIAKFSDIPAKQGHLFYREAVALAESLGLRP